MSLLAAEISRTDSPWDSILLIVQSFQIQQQ